MTEDSRTMEITAEESLRKINSVAVIGSGLMGSGIAQVFAALGKPTSLFDTNGASIDKAIAQISDRLQKGVEKGKVTADVRDRTLANLHPVKSLGELSGADIVIEAIVENFEIKQKLFRELEAIVRPETILASNTSSISITRIAGCIQTPHRVVGMHFMNPVPVMKLVEIIRGLQTSEAVYQTTKALVLALEKTPVTARYDYPGFIVNRILVPMINEAIFALMEGLASPEEIDTAMKLGTNQPMGPLELADFVGLDTCLSILQILHRELGDDKYRPCPLLTKYVEAGWYGKKSGRGFYQYS